MACSTISGAIILALLDQPEESLRAFQKAMYISGAQLVGTYETSLARQGYLDAEPDGEPDADLLAALRVCIAEACDLRAQ